MTRTVGSLPRRVRTLRAKVRTRSDALLVGRLLAWRIALAVLKRVVPIQRLARLMVSTPGPRIDDTRRIVDLVDWIYASRSGRDLDNCLDRSLVLYRFLSPHEPGTQLVIGMRRGTGELEGHAWITAGGRSIGAIADNGADFVPLAAFDARGHRLEGVEG